MYSHIFKTFHASREQKSDPDKIISTVAFVLSNKEERWTQSQDFLLPLPQDLNILTQQYKNIWATVCWHTTW